MQIEEQLSSHQTTIQQAEQSLCATVSAAGASSSSSSPTSSSAPPVALSQELALIESRQQQSVGPLLNRLERTLRLTVGPFDVEALTQQLLPAVCTFGGSVRSLGLPHRLGTLDPNTLQSIMAFSSPEANRDKEARRQWAAALLLVSTSDVFTVDVFVRVCPIDMAHDPLHCLGRCSSL